MFVASIRAIQIVSVWGLAERAILDNVDSDRRGKLEVPGSENSLRKLKKETEKNFNEQSVLIILFRVGGGTNNFRMPVSEDFFQGASSGSYGSGPCTGGSSSVGLQMFFILEIISTWANNGQ